MTDNEVIEMVREAGGSVYLVEHLHTGGWLSDEPRRAWGEGLPTSQLKRLTKAGRLDGATLRVSPWTRAVPEGKDRRYGGAPSMPEGTVLVVCLPGQWPAFLQRP